MFRSNGQNLPLDFLYLSVYNEISYAFSSAIVNKQADFVHTFKATTVIISDTSNMEAYMHKKTTFSPQRSTKKIIPSGPSSLAGRFLLLSLFLLSLGVCDLVARIYDTLTAGNAILWIYVRSDIECLLASVAILLGGGLFLDYVERLVERLET